MILACAEENIIEINDDNNTGVIVGSVIGGLGGLTLITILFYFLFLKLKKRQTKIEPNGEQEMKKVWFFEII